MEPPQMDLIEEEEKVHRPKMKDIFSKKKSKSKEKQEIKIEDLEPVLLPLVEVESHEKSTAKLFKILKEHSKEVPKAYLLHHPQKKSK